MTAKTAESTKAGPGGADSRRISVIICTYNRGDLLAAALRSVHQLTVPAGLDWEVVVVDNNSRDRTKEVVRGFEGKLPVRYVFEPQQGKTIALNRAVLEATGELLAFTDDDVQLDPAWLSELARAARAQPSAGWLGGRTLPLWPRGRPTWLHDESLAALSGFFVMHDLGDAERPYADEDDPPIGANMAVRRAVFERIGLYREDLGPSGQRRGTHDDSELIWRAQHAGIPGVYVPTAMCHHWVAPSRLRLRSFLSYGLVKGENQAKAGGPSAASGSLRCAAVYSLRGLYQACKLRRDRVGLCLINIGIELGRRRGTDRRVEK